MAAGSRFKRGVRKLGGSTLVAFERSRLRPELTVVMPVYNVAPFLREALDSALNGTLHDIELVAVDDGSTDECLEILREYERRDSRVRVFTQANAGQGTARNVGVSHARAEFLTFMDSDDTIPPEAFEHMVGHLRRSGSDFCVGGVRRFRGGRMIRTSWQRTVHQADRIATTIEEFPAAMQDIIACNRVFRTAFWREQVGDFRGGIAYEDHVPMLAAYVRARTFDVLAEVTYNWRIRENSTGQQKARLQNLLDRIEVKEEAHALLQAEASDFTYDVWVARCLEVDFPPFVGRALDGDDTYRATLAAAYRTFVERATDRAWDRVRVATKVRAHLVATERWDDVVAAMTYFISVNQVPPTRVTDGVLVAVLPDAPWAAGLPPHLLRMADLESHFQGVVEKVRRDGTALEVVGWMRHRGLDAPAPEISLELRSGEHRVPLGLENLVLPQANLWAPLPTSGCAHAGFRARIPLEQLRATAGPWSLVGSTTTDGLTSTGDFHYAVPGSSAERSRSFDVEIAGARLGVRTVWHPSLGFSLRLREGGLKNPPATLTGPLIEEVALADGEVVVTVSGATDEQLATAVLEQGSGRLAAASSGVGTVRFATGTLTPGDHALVLDGASPRPAPGFSDGFPLRLLGAGLRLTLTGRKEGVRFTVGPALADDELGRYHQHRLQAAYRASSPALSETILLTSFQGTAAAGDPLAVDRYLAEHHPGIERVWGVADHATAVPAGARAVLIGSRSWYDTAAGSRYVVANTDLGGWFEAKPGQRSLQTFRGHPFKAMGTDLWRSQGANPGEVRLWAARAREEWSQILLADPASADHYRAQFGYAGPTLVAGYPRTDALVNADAAAVRGEVLQRLGIDPASTVVLYAPTERDAAASEAYAAGPGPDLDLAALTEALGDDHVVLVRVPRTWRRPSLRAIRAGAAVDVSGVPDVTELLLAADAAVLDYGSLRFDWAITGKPAVFYVPDRDAYLGARAPLFDFDSSAPGPQVATAAAVAAALADLETLRASYADALGAFNQRFNTANDGRATERVVAALLNPGAR